MRDQGRLIEWFDDKGYGFIQPNDLKKDRVFLHIKNFAKPGPRPLVGCALEYTVVVDAKARYKALDVVYLKVSQIQKAKQPKNTVKPSNKSQPHLQPMQILCVAYIFLIAGLSFFGFLSGMLVLLLCLINAMTYWCYAQDKEAAQLGNQRIPEQVLHSLSFLGGWPAAWLAQQRLRHKTQKQPFKRIFYCTIFFNILLVIWLVSPLNHLVF